MVRIGHDMSGEEVLNRVSEYWDLSKPIPIPKFRLRCPICGADDEDIILRFANIVQREVPSENRYRSNVSFKCTRCSFTWVHGVVIPEEMARRHGIEGAKAKSFHWREIREMLEE